MKTPAGKECPMYYADFNRGRHVQRCDLVQRNPNSARWQPSDCAKCPVPEILIANASPSLRLTLTIHPGLAFGIGRRLEVTAHCDKHNVSIADPFVGCELCNAERPGLNAFLDALERGSTQDK
ncbi:MAG: hypothetical protein ACYDBJ_09160 [Aggregatilineales bacterium]